MCVLSWRSPYKEKVIGADKKGLSLYKELRARQLSDANDSPISNNLLVTDNLLFKGMSGDNYILDVKWKMEYG